MKKLVSIIVCFLMCFCFVGCEEENIKLFFSFNFSSITLEVGDNVDVFGGDISSNIGSYAQMHIFSSDDSIVSINGTQLQAESVGFSTITVSGVYNGVFLSDSFIVNVVDNNNSGNSGDNGGSGGSGENGGENNNGDNERTLSIGNYNEKLKSDKLVVTFDVLNNGEEYSSFTYQIVSGQENVIGEPTTLNCQFEIFIALNSQVEIVIYSENSSQNIHILLPYQAE